MTCHLFWQASDSDPSLFVGLPLHRGWGVYNVSGDLCHDDRPSLEGAVEVDDALSGDQAYAVCGGQKRSVITVYDALYLRSEMADSVHS